MLREGVTLLSSNSESFISGIKNIHLDVHIRFINYMVWNPNVYHRTKEGGRFIIMQEQLQVANSA